MRNRCTGVHRISVPAATASLAYGIGLERHKYPEADHKARRRNTAMLEYLLSDYESSRSPQTMTPLKVADYDVDSASGGRAVIA